MWVILYTDIKPDDPNQLMHANGPDELQAILAVLPVGRKARIANISKVAAGKDSLYLNFQPGSYVGKEIALDDESPRVYVEGRPRA